MVVSCTSRKMKPDLVKPLFRGAREALRSTRTCRRDGRRPCSCPLGGSSHLPQWPLGRAGERSSPEAGSAREKRKKILEEIWRGKEEMPEARARVYPERDSLMLSPLTSLVLCAPRKARWVWEGVAAKYLF